MNITRRAFLRSVTVGSAALTSCGYSAPQEPPVSPPPGAGRVVSARNPAVWQKGRLSAAGLGEMLDAAVAAHARQPDARRAWSTVCKPGDRVAIKVNATERGATHALLALTIAERLQVAGVRPDRIVIYDRTSRELSDAGFPVASSGERVRCYGTESDYGGDWTISGRRIRLSRVLTDCDVLINVPVLKAFAIGGLSFGMKNHYGSFDVPHRFHGSSFTPGVVALNALDPIRTRTHLIVGDVLAPELRDDAAGYAVIGGESSLLVATDPVALDRVGVQMASEALVHAGRDPRSTQDWATRWLSDGEKRGLGVADRQRIAVERVRM